MLGSNKIWTNFRNDILAADEDSAAFLADYLSLISINRNYLHVIELHDMQAYKITRHPKKLRYFLREKTKTPFVFIGYLN